MGLLEDLNSGKYNLILFGILFIFMFHQYWNKNTELMGDVGNQDQIKEAVKQVYMADVESIRNLSNVAAQLQAGGLTIPGDLTVKGKFILDGAANINSGQILLGKQEANMWALNANQTDNGAFVLGRIGRDGKPNEKIGLKLISSADGTQNLGGSFSLIPKGTVVAWSGDKAPNGWELCDGKDGRPDLLGRFILGSGNGKDLANRKLGELGGSETNKLNNKNIPEHTHTYSKTKSSKANEAHKDGTRDLTKSISYDDEKTSAFGEKEPSPFNIMPPYYVLAYIIKL